MLNLLIRGWLLLGLVAPVAAGECEIRDFLSLTLPAPDGRPPEAVALELAYPGVTVAAGSVTIPGRATLPLGEAPGRPPETVLESASIAEQFAQAYPLEFDLQARRTPWMDPGRARNTAFFKALWFDAPMPAARSLREVRFARTGARFHMTNRFCVAAQLGAALEEIAAQGPEMDRFFRDVGGSFNWRCIAGTDRLSAHSYGIALDLNATLGGYWRWAGESAGQVGSYDNQIPEALVRAMERRGFIWGGKWHHYDGMHFEYRPELILHARLAAR